MKCYSNPHNPASLRIIIAGAKAGKTLNLEFVEPHEWKVSSIRRLPTLELSDGNQIFSSNAAAKYLWKPDNKVIIDVDIWLEWDSTILQPILCAINPEKLVDESLTIVFQKVTSALKSNKFLVSDELTLADVAVWSSLYGIITHPLISQCTTDCIILNWFKEVSNDLIVMNAVNVWGDKTGPDVIKAFCSGNYFPSVNIKKEDIPLNDNSIDPVEASISPHELNKVKLAWENNIESFETTFSDIPMLPKCDKKNVFVTSALPYVNNVPHLGNIIGCVLSADCFARLRGWNTLYIGGTDEYGTATETKALEEGLTPQEICDKYFVIHRDIYEWFNIKFDHFGRTTTEKQTEITQEIFWDVHNNGYTSIQSVEQLLCQHCDRFLADRFVEGICPKCKFEDARGDQCDGCGQLINAIELINPKCKICNNMPIIKNSDQLFLELPKIEKTLRTWIESSSCGWSNNARAITNTWLKDGLRARCITRDLKWGVPVPLKGFENKVFYVWFDAPIGYISITAGYTDEWRKWWQPSKETPITYYEFMAKDNVPFHSVMFPSSLLAVNKNFTLVNHIMATEYLNYEDGKFSKSRGIGVFGTDAKDTGLPADIFRFYLLYVRPEAQDTSFSWEDLAMKHNNELLNNVGNFVNRALTFTEKNFDSIIPKMLLNDDDFKLLAAVTRELISYNSALEKGKLRDGIKYMLNISRHGNQYWQSSEPWVLIKGSEEEKIKAATVIGVSCNLVALLAITIQPYMPKISEAMCIQVNFPVDKLLLTNEVYQLLHQGHKIGKPEPLFSKIELSTAQNLKTRFGGKQKSVSPVPDSQPSYKSITSIIEMEAAIEEQGDCIRGLKADKKEKSEWMPLVEVLKDMKLQLEYLKKNSPTSNHCTIDCEVNSSVTPTTNGKKKSKGKKC